MSNHLAPASGRHLSSCGPHVLDEPPVAVNLLGDLQVVVGGREVPVSSRRQRALISLLALSANRVVPSERLVDQLWDGTPPPGALVTLRSYVSHLRRAISGAGAGLRLGTADAGYRLEVDEDALDLVRFRRLVSAAHRLLRSGERHAAIAEFERALCLWRGRPLVDLADHEATVPQVVELTELHAGAVEGRLRALVEVGRHVEAIPTLEVLVADSPLRETPYELLMLALHRAGRSAEALELHRRYRALLRGELGIDPGVRLGDLEAAILRRDPRLDVPPGAPPAEATAADAEPSVVAVLTELIATWQAVSAQTARVVELLAGGDGYAEGVVATSRSWGGAGRPNRARSAAASAASRSAS